MPAFDVLDALVRGGNGVLRTADAVAAGITRPVLGNYVRERDLERVGHGLYLAPDAWKDGMYLLHLRCPQAVFSHDTALFLHDLTDREPLAYTVTVKSGYNPHRLKGDGVKVYRIKAELHGLGLSQTNTPFGNWYYKLHKNNNKDIFITENFANTRGKMQMKCCNFLENNATY